MRIILLFIFIFPLYLFGYSYNSIIISDDFESTTLSSSLYYIVDHNISADSITKLNLDSFNTNLSEHFSIGYTLHNYWLAFNVENHSNSVKHLQLELSNPRLNKIRIVAQTNGKIIETALGDYLPFHERSVYHRNFIYDIELNLNENRTFFIHLDRKGENLYTPIFLWDKEIKSRRTNFDNLVLGALVGCVIIYIILLLLYFVFVPSNLIIFYILFLISSLLAFLTEKGFGYQYLWSSFPRFQQMALVFLGGITIIFWILFITSFFNVNKGKVFNRITKILISIHLFKLFLALMYMINVVGYTENLKYPLFVFYNLVNLFTLSYLSYISLSSLVRNRNRENYILVLTFLVTLSSAILFLSKEKGWLTPSFLADNAFAFSILLEMILVSIVLFLRYKKNISEKQSLEKNMLIQQNISYQNLLIGQVEERKRLSAELHDGVSIDLTLIQHQIANLKDTSVELNKNRISSDLKNVIKNVHAFAQDLQPIELDELGLKAAIEELIIRVHNQDESLEVNFNTNIERTLNKKLGQNIYQIVKELLNNSKKHSKASIADIDLYVLNKKMELSFGDNGVGYALDKNMNGIGLKSIRNRIKVLGGEIDITNKLSGGIYYKIIIPL